MNNIKPRWVVIGFAAVGALWLTETSNRPVAIPDYSVRDISHLNREHRTASTPYEPIPAKPVDPLSVVDRQVAEQKKVKPMSARMMVANRGEFFAVNSMALPAQERTNVVDMGFADNGLKDDASQQEQCKFKGCTGLGASDH